MWISYCLPSLVSLLSFVYISFSLCTTLLALAQRYPPPSPFSSWYFSASLYLYLVVLNSEVLEKKEVTFRTPSVGLSFSSPLGIQFTFVVEKVSSILEKYACHSFAEATQDIEQLSNCEEHSYNLWRKGTFNSLQEEELAVYCTVGFMQPSPYFRCGL